MNPRREPVVRPIILLDVIGRTDTNSVKCADLRPNKAVLRRLRGAFKLIKGSEQEQVYNSGRY